MSKELIIRCDKCRSLIEENPYKIQIFTEERESISNEESHMEISEEDLCDKCIEELRKHIKKFFEQEKEEAVKEGKRKKIDLGRIKALYEAGWSIKEIAGEMGVTQQTIYVKINELGLRSENDE